MPKDDRQRKWDAENTKRFSFQVMRKTEADILEKLESVDNVAGYIKSLIRKDIGSLPKQTTD